VELLPPEHSPRDAWLNLKLSEIAAYTQLQFWDRVDSLVGAVVGIEDLNTCRESLDRCSVFSALWPCVYFAVFHAYRNDKPEVAFQFAIESIHGKNSTRGAGREERMEAVERWLEEKQMNRECISCDKNVEIESRTCPICNQAVTSFSMNRTGD
jgi:hypothetical protein